MKLRETCVCLLFASMFATGSSSTVLAKDGYELSKEAEKLQLKEQQKAAEAVKDENKSLEAAERGKRGAAAEHAEEAAKEQNAARELEKEASKVERKAVRKGY
jgi:hypothetical protein